MSKYTATHIANYFIENTIYVDNIRLNKLVYITYGAYYAYYNEELFQDRIEAWKFGPVIPIIYHDFKHYGNNKIDKASYIMWDNEEDLVIIPRVDKDDEKTKLILDSVIDIYGKMPANELVKRTHKVGTPWKDTYVSDQLGLEIDKELIKNYYLKLIKTPNNS